jgi:hypothetical protein
VVTAPDCPLRENRDGFGAITATTTPPSSDRHEAAGRLDTIVLGGLVAL